MTVDRNDFLQLSRIAKSWRSADPEIAWPNRRPTWATMSYVTLLVCAVLVLVGLATGAAAASLVGGVVLITIYPFLLVMMKKERGNHLHANE